MTGTADALQVVLGVVVVRDAVIDLGRRRDVADSTDGVAAKDSSASAVPVLRKARAPVASGPGPFSVLGAGLKVRAARLGAGPRGAGHYLPKAAAANGVTACWAQQGPGFVVRSTVPQSGKGQRRPGAYGPAGSRFGI